MAEAAEESPGAIYRFGWIGSLLLFLAFVGLHVCAILDVFVPPPPAAILFFAAVLPGQLLTIAGLNGGTLFPGRKARESWGNLEWARATWTQVPVGWLAFHTITWLYLLTVFLGLPPLRPALGEVTEARSMTIVTSVFFASFALMHFVQLRYVVPYMYALGRSSTAGKESSSSEDGWGSS